MGSHKKSTIDLCVGIFMLLGLLAAALLAFKVSGFSGILASQTYNVSANFANIGDLKTHAPVTIAGVRIGEVVAIHLNPKTYEAEVIMQIQKGMQNLPTDTAASIFTQGLLGSNYVNLDPGYADTMLKHGDKIAQTHPALILENLIGQFLFKISNDNKG